MARTHHLPDEQVHFTWDAGNEPRVDGRPGDTVVVRDARRRRQPDQAGLRRERHRRAGLGSGLPARRARSASRAPSPATRSRSRSSTSTPRAGAGRPSCPGLGLLPEDFPDAYLRVFDLSHGDVAYLREDIAIPLTPFFGTMGVCPAGASAQPVMPPGTFGGNMDTRQLVRGATLYLPVQVERRAVLLRRRARLPGRRRGLRHRPGGADVRHAALHAAEGPLDPGPAVPHRRRR